MLFPVILALLLGGDAASSKKVSVSFFGESGCPFCQRFVIDDLPTVVDDKELAGFVDFNFYPWGNAYFGTEECGSGPYDPQERACWAKLCQASPDRCFEGNPVYQHGAFEGALNVYEGCAKHQDHSSSKSVGFLRCVEKKLHGISRVGVPVEQIMAACGEENQLDVDSLKQCSLQNEKDKNIEIENAKATPPHPGVPWVIVNGTPMSDLSLKEMVCKNLQEEKLETCQNLQDARIYKNEEPHQILFM